MTFTPALQDLFALGVIAAVYAFYYLRSRKGPQGSDSTASQAPQRVLQQDGKEYVKSVPILACEVLPDPDPLVDFDLATASTRDYIYANKTMRYPYFQTMSHQPMHINHWIEIDNEYEWYLGEKARIVEEQGKVALDSLPENDDACGELLELVVDYLPKRFPTLFERIPSGLGIWNKVTNERFPDVSALRGVEALRVVSRLVQDDFLMARERPDGRTYLVGGLLAFPGNYLLSEKMDQPVHVLHDPVPHFNSKLLLSVERTLVRFTPDKPFERSSWMIVDDRSLFWHNIASVPVPDTLHPKDLFLRVDHQTFRKLRRTGGIMFGVHPVLKRIGTLADSPLVPAMLAKLHTESDKALLDYKLVEKYNPILLPYLQEVTEQQIARGLIREEDLEDVSKFREHVGGEFPMWHVKPTREAQAVH